MDTIQQEYRLLIRDSITKEMELHSTKTAHISPGARVGGQFHVGEDDVCLTDIIIL